LNNAEAAQPPSGLPNHVSEFGFLAARIIVQEGEANLYSVASAYDTLFTPGVSADHGELAGLSDDDHPQYVLHTEITDSMEGDPFFNDSDAFPLQAAWMTDWNTSFGWGDHGVAGYLTSTFWNRDGRTLYPATDDDDIHINGTSEFDNNVTINDTVTMTNTTSSYSWDIYVDVNGTMVWKWN